MGDLSNTGPIGGYDCSDSPKATLAGLGSVIL